jgi:hypothetical protein
MGSSFVGRHLKVALAVLSSVLLVYGCVGSSDSPGGVELDASTGDVTFPKDDANGNQTDGTTEVDAADASVADTFVPDGPVSDHAAPDTGLDAGSDVEVDTGADADTDAGADAAVDTGTDAPLDTGADAPLDTGTDAPLEAAADASFPTTANLIVNGDAEQGTGSTDGTVVVAVPSWAVANNGNVLIYGATGGYPTATDPGPPSRGLNFFSGGPNDTVSTLAQSIDVSVYAAAIRQGAVTFALSGWLGGYSSQDDNATVTISFLDAAGADAGATDAGNAVDAGDAGAPLGTATIGPVLASDRGSATGLLLRTTTGLVPPGTVAIAVQVTMTRLSGTANDGYADSLSLTLTGN